MYNSSPARFDSSAGTMNSSRSHSSSSASVMPASTRKAALLTSTLEDLRWLRLAERTTTGLTSHRFARIGDRTSTPSFRELLQQSTFLVGQVGWRKNL